MANSFGWTQEMVDAHNARVGGVGKRGTEIKTVKQAIGILQPGLTEPTAPVVLHGGLGFEPRTSKDESKLNKTERTFLQYLRKLPGISHIGIQGITFKIGDDCRYTPDFSALKDCSQLYLYEVKGFMRDDALVKLKVCARMYPWAILNLVRKDNAGWNIKIVEP